MNSKLNIKVIKDGAATLFFIVIVAFIVNLFHPKGFIFISKKTNLSNQIVELSVKEAKSRFDLKSGIFIDSRRTVDFKKEHIKGAIHIPAQPLSMALKKIKAHMKILSSSRDIVIYCTGEACGSSKKLAQLFIKKGFSRHIYIIKKGFPSWKSLGFPTE